MTGAVFLLDVRLHAVIPKSYMYIQMPTKTRRLRTSSVFVMLTTIHSAPII